jgi:hypothetical protein
MSFSFRNCVDLSTRKEGYLPSCGGAGQFDAHHIHKVVEVFPKSLLPHLFDQIFVGGRDDPRIRAPPPAIRGSSKK